MRAAARNGVVLRHHRRASGAARPARGQRGETLIELLATIVVMGLGVVGVLTMLSTTILLTAQYRASSRANLTLHEYAETLKQPIGTMVYKPCATDSDGADPYEAFQAAPNGFTAEIIEIEHWNGQTDAAGELEWTSTCDDHGLQRIAIEVVSPDGKTQTSERLVLIKRDQRCPVPIGADPAAYEGTLC